MYMKKKILGLRCTVTALLSGGRAGRVTYSRTRRAFLFFFPPDCPVTHTHTHTHARTPARVTRNWRVCCVIRPITPCALAYVVDLLSPTNPIPRVLPWPDGRYHTFLYIYIVFGITRSKSQFSTAPISFESTTKLTCHNVIYISYYFIRLDIITAYEYHDVIVH